MHDLSLTDQELQLLWTTIDQSQFPGAASELVAAVRAKMVEASQPKPPTQPNPFEAEEVPL